MACASGLASVACALDVWVRVWVYACVRARVCVRVLVHLHSPASVPPSACVWAMGSQQSHQHCRTWAAGARVTPPPTLRSPKSPRPRQGGAPAPHPPPLLAASWPALQWLLCWLPGAQ